MNENPFPITAYMGPQYFCDRQKETAQLKEALMNGRNIVLFSPRRMGKTGLIHHFFHTMQGEPVNTIYADIFGTEDMNGFINKLANAVLKVTPGGGDNLLKKAMNVFGSIRPQLSYNALSGIPQVSFTLQNDAEKQSTLAEVFALLEKQKKKSILAIDEFQQIIRYPEKNIEEQLRSHIQHLKKTHFIFSGSQRHILSPMFADPKRAFYQSSTYLALGKLDPGGYNRFIRQHFSKGRQAISAEDIDFILDWTKCYTFYTQYVCNRIFSNRQQKVTREEIMQCLREILAEREPVFYNFRNLLSLHQYRLLTAIALEDQVSEPTGQEFMKKYDLSNASTVRKSLHALIEKEMIYQKTGQDKPLYEIYDVFLSRWFAWRSSLA